MKATHNDHTGPLRSSSRKHVKSDDTVRSTVQRPAESTTQMSIGRDLRSSGALHRAIAADLDGSVDMNPLSGIEPTLLALGRLRLKDHYDDQFVVHTFRDTVLMPVRWVETVSKNPIAKPAGYRIQDYLVRSIEAAFMFTLSG